MPKLNLATDLYEAFVVPHYFRMLKFYGFSYRVKKEIYGRNGLDEKIITYYVIHTDGLGALALLDKGIKATRVKPRPSYGSRPKYPYKRYHLERFEIREGVKPKIPKPDGKRKINLTMLESENIVKQ